MGGAVAEFLRLDAFGQGTLQRLGLPEQADVDVGGVVELKGAVLAHGQTEQAGDGAARVVSRGDQLAPLALVMRDGPQGGLGRGVGETAERVGDGVQIPDAAEIAQGGQQVQFGLEPAQRRPDVVSAAGQGGGRGQDGRQPVLGRRLQRQPKPFGPAARQSAQIGRGGEDGGERVPGGLKTI